MKKYVFDIPAIEESLKRDYKKGNLTLEQIAKELYQAGHTCYIDLEYAKKVISD